MRARHTVRHALTTIAVTAILMALTGGGVAQGAQKSKTNASLTGSWTVRITGGPGTPALPTWYGAQMTATPGGGLIATITDPNIQTGHGAWRQIGKRSFAVTILLFQFDSSGAFQGTLKARATLRVDRKSQAFESKDYRFEFFDPNGVPTGFGGVGAAHGTRIKVER
jgi:hypothetical protein